MGFENPEHVFATYSLDGRLAVETAELGIFAKVILSTPEYLGVDAMWEVRHSGPGGPVRKTFEKVWASMVPGDVLVYASPKLRVTERSREHLRSVIASAPNHFSGGLAIRKRPGVSLEAELEGGEFAMKSVNSPFV